MTLFGPGIYYGIPFDVYRAIPAVSQSDLKNFISSPAKYNYYKGIQKKETEALLIGSVTHCLVFEGSTFKERFYVAPKVNRTTKEGKALAAQYKQEAGERSLIFQDDYQIAVEMAAAVVQHNTARNVCAGGQAEVSLVWLDPETNLLCKGRLDYWNEDRATIVDLKTVRGSVTERAFTKAVIERGYHYQNAWYTRGLRILGQPEQRFFFIAVEKEGPYGVCVYELSDDAIARANKALTTLVARFDECQKRNFWPGYPEGINRLELPSYEIENMECIYGKPRIVSGNTAA